MGKADPQKSEIVLYQTDDGHTRLEVKLENETAWLTQGQMAELFQTTILNVSMHIRNLFSDGELKPDSVGKESLTTAADGKTIRRTASEIQNPVSATQVFDSGAEIPRTAWRIGNSPHTARRILAARLVQPRTYNIKVDVDYLWSSP